jgi:hypothetical protein
MSLQLDQGCSITCITLPAEDLIAYLLAPEKMSEEGKEKLKVNYNKARGYNYVHPDGREAEELPLAVKAPAAA